MRLLLYTDPHWSASSSIVRGRGEKYSQRLENVINSISWVESLATLEKCNSIICLGDFFDSSQIDSETITALKDVSWNQEISHIFLTGNHEIGRSNIEYSSCQLFSLCNNSTVIDSCENYIIDGEEDTELYFLPYCPDSTKPIAEYFHNLNDNVKRRIVFSHNDIKGIQMGGFISNNGFDIQDIESFCDIFLNGHLHNGQQVSNKIYNLGNLTGQNFGEDASRYPHFAYIIDTQTLKLEKYENPYAFNFYKFDVNGIEDFDCKITKIKKNAVVTVKCDESIASYVKDRLLNINNIVESRVLINIVKNADDKADNAELIGTTTSHIDKFISYVKENVGTDSITLEELEVIRNA